MKYHLTNDGYALLIRGLAGDAIRFTKVAIGDCNLKWQTEIDYKNMKALIRQVYETKFDAIQVEDGFAKLSWTLDSTIPHDEAENPIFHWLETGIFAADPDGGDDILYAYASEFEDSNLGDHYGDVMIPHTKVDVDTYISQEISIYIGDVEDVSAEIGKNMPFASKQEFDAHINERNPHGTTLQDIGITLDAIGIRTYKEIATSSNKYYSEKNIFIPFSIIPQNAVLFISHEVRNGIDVTSGSPGVFFETHEYASGADSPSTGWKITVKMYNFTGTIEVHVLGIGG